LGIKTGKVSLSVGFAPLYKSMKNMGKLPMKQLIYTFKDISIDAIIEKHIELLKNQNQRFYSSFFASMVISI